MTVQAAYDSTCRFSIRAHMHYCMQAQSQTAA